MRRWYYLVSVLTLCPLGVLALSADDFVPSFLSTSKANESANLNPETAFSLPENSRARIANSGDDWYCQRGNGSFCAHQNASQAIAKKLNGSAPVTARANQGANEQYFNPNSNNYDQNAVANFNITNANQTALQGYSPKLNNYTTQEQIKQNVAVPIQTDKNTNISVGTNQINFNMSY